MVRCLGQVLARLRIERSLFHRIGAEHFHRPRHAADFVAPVGVGHGHVEVALGQGHHDLLDLGDRPHHLARRDHRRRAGQQQPQETDGAKHHHGLVQDRHDRRPVDGNHQGANDGPFSRGNGPVADQIRDAIEVRFRADRLVGLEGRKRLGACHDGIAHAPFARSVYHAGADDHHIGAGLGVEVVDGHILARDRCDGVNHVIGAQARHAAGRQRCHIAGLVQPHFEVGQIDLQDLRGDAGGIAQGCSLVVGH